MNVDELLDLMDETLEDGMPLPLGGGKRMVDVEKVREIINDIRESLPGEISQARNIVSDRSQILSDAKAESEKIIQTAEKKARAMVEEQEIVKAAKKRAEEILAEANARSKSLLVGVFGRCDSVMADTEDRLLKYAADIKMLRATLRKNPGNK